MPGRLTDNDHMMAIYHRAETLVEKRQFKEALADFQTLLSTAASENVIMLIQEYTRIMMSIGFCYADLSEWDQALDTYHKLEVILKQEEGWMKGLPKGLRVGIPASFAPALSLATLSD